VAGEATFTVTDWQARRRCVQPDIADIAKGIAADAAANTPRRTGRMASSYRVVQGQDPATSLVVNDAPWAIFVEYGTRHVRAAAPLGRALSRARSGS
jgi:hypothetical protein